MDVMVGAQAAILDLEAQARDRTEMSPLCHCFGFSAAHSQLDPKGTGCAMAASFKQLHPSSSLSASHGHPMEDLRVLGNRVGLLLAGWLFVLGYRACVRAPYHH